MSDSTDFGESLFKQAIYCSGLTQAQKGRTHES